MHPVERPRQTRRERVRDLHQLTAVLELDEMTVSLVAIAQVEPELDPGWDVPREPEQPFEDAAADLGEPGFAESLQHPELGSGVPLDGELIGWDRGEDLGELAQQGGFVDGLERRLKL